MPDICWLFLDKPEMQRLKNILQLGPNYLVFPGATHNRFEHSVGTAYLCESQMNFLRQNHQMSTVSKLSSDVIVPFTEKEQQCVVLAGLFHDLGHGIYSHLFDRQVMKVILGK